MDTQTLFLQTMTTFISNFPQLKADKTTPKEKETMRLRCYEKPGAFWHEVDIRRFELCNMRYFTQALGWQQDVTLTQFMQLIHPAYQLPFTLLAIYGYEMFLDIRNDPNYFNYEIHIPIPLQHATGKYYWFTQRSYMISVDEDHVLTSHINRYTFEGEWNRFERRLFQCFVTENGLNAAHVTQMLADKIHQYFLKHLTPHEIRLLGHYAAGCTIEKIQHYYNRSRDYIREMNARILKKTQAYTGTAFTNTLQVAQYLLEKGLIMEMPID